MRGPVLGKPLSTIVEELNNVLTVVAMCADELEGLGPKAGAEPMQDMRDAVRRGAELTRLLHELAAAPGSEPRLVDKLVDSDVRPTHGARRR